MMKTDRPRRPLTPSQQAQGDKILAILARAHVQHRPFLLTGDVGVGKSFLAHTLALESAAYYNVVQDCLRRLLTEYSLSDLTPEAVVRFARELITTNALPYAVIDGLEPLLSMWAVERFPVRDNFFISLRQAVLDQPALVVVQTSDRYLPKGLFRDDRLWPCDRCFHLELTLADMETVAKSWGVDPVRAHISANLYELLASKLGG